MMPVRDKMISTKRRFLSVFTFVVLVLVVVVLIIKIDSLLFKSGADQARTKNDAKFEEIVSYISSYYVDEVNWNDAYLRATNSILEQLDPHSIYVTASEAETNEENFQGQYEGIGIQFDIIDSYITVISAIHDSPADKVGLLSGDRIIKIEGNSVVGIDQSIVPRLLKGKSGTKVHITVMRAGITEPLEFTIIRQSIPIFSVTDYFMNTDSTGYIYLNRFAKTTVQELDQVLTTLESQGMRRLILDLRWNAGGLLDEAVKVTSRFLSGHKKIVYTRARVAEFNEEYYADTFGPRKVRDYPLIILINYASASAAEIVAGAIQDYDRGLIVGTTSFGKGLVQREFPLHDNSRLRLTISKYYTPSGRLIQKPYKGKNLEQYYDESTDSLALKHTQADSIDTLALRSVFYTTGGRKVYSGGGINPDVEIEPATQTYSSALIQQIKDKHLFFEVGSRFAETHPELKSDPAGFLTGFKVDNQLLVNFTTAASKKGIEINSAELEQYYHIFTISLKAEIARGLWGDEKYHRVLLEDDNQYRSALHLFSEAEQLLIRIENSVSTKDSAR